LYTGINTDNTYPLARQPEAREVGDEDATEEAPDEDAAAAEEAKHDPSNGMSRFSIANLSQQPVTTMATQQTSYLTSS
jgi:hypothetical protein